MDNRRVLIDGTDIREYDYDHLLEQISIIFQDVYLFEDTVRNNICLGRPEATEAQMAAPGLYREFVNTRNSALNWVVGKPN